MALAAAPYADGQPNPAVAGALQSVGQLAASLRATSGDLRELRVPDDANRAEIERFIGATGDIAAFYESVGRYLVSHQTGQADQSQTEQIVVEAQNLAIKTMPTWDESAQRLGLTQCLVVMGSTAPTPPR